MSFTEKGHVQIANNPRSPQCQTEPELLCSSSPPLMRRVDFLGGSPHVDYSKSQLDAPIYWRCYSGEQHFVLALPVCHEIAISYADTSGK